MDHIRTQFKGLPRTMVKVQRPLPMTVQLRKWTKDTETQKHPIRAYPGIIPKVKNLTTEPRIELGIS